MSDEPISDEEIEAMYDAEYTRLDDNKSLQHPDLRGVRLAFARALLRREGERCAEEAGRSPDATYAMHAIRRLMGVPDAD